MTPTKMTEIMRKHRAASEPNADAHVDAYLIDLATKFLSNGGKINKLPTVGRPLKCQKWYQADYRSATPKGVVLKSAAVRGEFKRFTISN